MRRAPLGIFPLAAAASHSLSLSSLSPTLSLPHRSSLLSPFAHLPATPAERSAARPSRAASTQPRAQSRAQRLLPAALGRLSPGRVLVQRALQAPAVPATRPAVPRPDDRRDDPSALPAHHATEPFPLPLHLPALWNFK
jgi:hypothetical protein